MPYSFAAGPARLPDAVLAQARETLFSRGADGAAPVDRPFSAPQFRAALAHAQARLRALLGVPDGYRILFLAGGAMHQFAMVPANLATPGGMVAYADSGYWAQRAMAEAARQHQVCVVARHEGTQALAAPPLQGWQLPPGSAYCHITPNETVEGIAYPGLPDVGDVPLVADCTSSFLTAPLPIARFGLVYAGAQKNLGIAGLAVVVIQEALLARSSASLASVASYRLQAQAASCVNTPPVAALLVTAMVLDWIDAQGGLPAMGEANQRKAATLYCAIDASQGFFCAPVALGHRSLVNVRFCCANAALDTVFATEAEAAGLHHLRGHPRIGGLRASLYNAMPQAGVDALVDFMAHFQRRYG